jgi:hypothetical protein
MRASDPKYMFLLLHSNSFIVLCCDIRFMEGTDSVKITAKKENPWRLKAGMLSISPRLELRARGVEFPYKVSSAFWWHHSSRSHGVSSPSL